MFTVQRVLAIESLLMSRYSNPVQKLTIFLFCFATCCDMGPSTSEAHRIYQKIRKTDYGTGENERGLNVWQRQSSKGRKG